MSGAEIGAEMLRPSPPSRAAGGRRGSAGLVGGGVQHRFKRTMRKHRVSGGERAADGLRPITAVLPRSLIDRLALAWSAAVVTITVNIAITFSNAVVRYLTNQISWASDVTSDFHHHVPGRSGVFPARFGNSLHSDRPVARRAQADVAGVRAGDIGVWWSRGGLSVVLAGQLRRRFRCSASVQALSPCGWGWPCCSACSQLKLSVLDRRAVIIGVGVGGLVACGVGLALGVVQDVSDVVVHPIDRHWSPALSPVCDRRHSALAGLLYS